MRIPNILLGAACAAALAGTLGLATALPAHAHDAKPVDAVSIDTPRRELASSNTRLGGGDDRPAAEITPLPQFKHVESVKPEDVKSQIRDFYAVTPTNTTAPIFTRIQTFGLPRRRKKLMTFFSSTLKPSWT